MRVPLLLLRCISRAGLNAVGFGFAGDLVVDLLPEVAKGAWSRWSEEADGSERREELQGVAQADTGEFRDAVKQVVEEEAADQPVEVRNQMTAYLMNMQSCVRRTVRGPSTGGDNLQADDLDDFIALMPPRPSHFQPGDLPLSGVDWRLAELLGVGGFGEVWKAEHAHLSSIEPVALKFCLDPSAANLLRHEAGVLDRVMRHGRHEGIVQLRQTYLSAEAPCLEYELVEGGDLSGVIGGWRRSRKRGELAPSLIAESRQAIHRLTEITAFAHEVDPPIVHRDLKPANILTKQCSDGNLVFKIADFGIGAVSARKAAQSASGVTQGQLLSNTVRGSHTPLYASPQQMRGEEPDPSDDVYSLGVIWYQMLTTDLAAGAPSGRLWPKRLAEQGVSDDEIDLLASCIEPEAADRPASARVLLDKLGDFREAKTERPKSASTRKDTAASLITPVSRGGGNSAPPAVARNEGADLVSLAKEAAREGLVLIEKGVFVMGSEDGDAAERPTHDVWITKPFFLADRPVTQGEFDEIISADTRPSRSPQELSLPVCNVTWFEAIEYCNRLSVRDGASAFYRIYRDKVTIVGGDGYRLPTEAEWEFACRTGKQSRWSFGDDEKLLGQYGWCLENSGGQAKPPARRKPNAWKLYDMHGNVWEWCWDWHSTSYYRHSPRENPVGPGSGKVRVVRGGSHAAPAAAAASSARDGVAPDGRYDDVGFRVARSVG